MTRPQPFSVVCATSTLRSLFSPKGPLPKAFLAPAGTGPAWLPRPHPRARLSPPALPHGGLGHSQIRGPSSRRIADSFISPFPLEAPRPPSGPPSPSRSRGARPPILSPPHLLGGLLSSRGQREPMPVCRPAEDATDIGAREGVPVAQRESVCSAPSGSPCPVELE